MRATSCLLIGNKLDDTRFRLGSNVSPEMISQMWDRWDRCFMDNASTSDSSVDYSSPALNNALSKFSYTNIVFLLARGSIFIVTKSGYIGLGPLCAEVGEGFLYSTAHQLQPYFERFCRLTQLGWDSRPLKRRGSRDGKLSETGTVMGSWTMRLQVLSGGRRRKRFELFEG
jgi:hypothetical protein